MSFGPFLLLALMEGMVTAAVLSLAAVGLCLVFGVMRVVNVAHGEFYMLGAVIAWFVASVVPGPAWAVFLAALVVAPVLVGALAAAADGLILK
ncbi:MAG: branched-chain amino acid ABC transporter permease, partial [Paracoccaceae bacterium]